MKVGLYHHERLPVEKYGGVERVMIWLARGLKELGHEPVLLTPPESRVEEFPTHVIPARAFKRMEIHDDFSLDPYLPGGLDVVHFHDNTRGSCAVPAIFTVHGNAWASTIGPREVFVSRDHMTRMGGAHFVYNGIDPHDYCFAAEKEDFLLFLGLASRSVKGVDRAERIARMAGRELVIAGGRRFNLSRKIRSVGLVDNTRKRELLARASALLNPIRWAEPFGLVVIEALASGTPVLAPPLGSMPELVTADVGFLCEHEEEFAQAIDRIGELDPAACRARVEGGFTHVHMARGYVELYRRAISGTLERGS
mgnify:CR=1 FL=1